MSNMPQMLTNEWYYTLYGTSASMVEKVTAAITNSSFHRFIQSSAKNRAIIPFPDERRQFIPVGDRARGGSAILEPTVL